MHASKRAAKITGTGGKNKTAVLGILERGGKVRTKIVDNTRKKTLQFPHFDAMSAYRQTLLS